MINPNKFNGGATKVFIIGDNGEKTLIGEAQSFKVNQEITMPKGEPVSLISRSFSGTLNNVSYDAKALFNQLIQGANTGFDITVSKRSKKYRELRSKKKRLVKKRNKQLCKEALNDVTYKNCVITGMEESW